MIERALHQRGLELIEVQTKTHKSGNNCTVYVDTLSSETHVSADTLAEVHQALNKQFDNWDIGVSSPGIDRMLTKKSHFDSVIGKKIKLQTNFKHYEGVLSHITDEGPILKHRKHKQVGVPWDAITKANLVWEF